MRDLDASRANLGARRAKPRDESFGGVPIAAGDGGRFLDERRGDQFAAFGGHGGGTTSPTAHPDGATGAGAEHGGEDRRRPIPPRARE